jgi:hypothetical protein
MMKFIVIGCLATLFLLAVPATVSADAPLISVSDVTTEATGPEGAQVTYSITASDDNGPPQIVCSPSDGSTFPLGTTGASCTATDLVDPLQPSTTANFSVTVQDTTPPVVTVPAAITVEASGPNGAVVDYSGESAIDAVSGSLTSTCAPASGSTFPLGTTTVTCTATDDAGNTGSNSFTITVQDTTPPVVTGPAAISVDATGPGGAVVTFSASATDTVSGNLTPSCSPPSGSSFPVGTTTDVCTATDGSGNSGSNSFTVTVKDTTPPTLTLPAPITAEATGPSGATVTYTASATDDVSGTLTPSCSPASGSTFPLGTTTVTCTATDAAGNSTSGTFTITVRDTTAPTLNLPAPITAEATGPNGAIVTYTATATDAVSGNLAASCAPASGATFPLGVTTVGCSATDGAGNKTSGQFTVTVDDTTAPVISVPSAQIKVEATDAGGSTLTYTMPTALDVVDGPVPVSCSPKPGARFPLGATTVTCTAADHHANVASASFKVLVVDTTAPVLTVPAPITVSSNGASTLAATDPTISAFLSGAIARDIVSGSVLVKNDAPANFALGTTTVTFSAQDDAGNTATARSAVTVVAQAVQPVKPPDRTPPDDVRGVSIKIGNRLLQLSWKPPLAPDFDHVRITRSSTVPGAPEATVYTGAGTDFIDRRVLNGTDYRYVIVAFDHAGNRSAGIAAIAAPKATLLVRPANGAKVTAPPTLLWVPTAGATYYNVQLFRGNQKIYSAWPVADRLKLAPKWKYAGRRFQLTPGLYRWYVFPGLGARRATKYGPVLGTSTFAIVKTRKKS